LLDTAAYMSEATRLLEAIHDGDSPPDAELLDLV
jgi:hypothetical protein